MIKTFLIIKKSGIPLYVWSKDKIFDIELISGFLTAIQNFAENLNQVCVDSINLSEDIYYYAVKEEIMAIIIAKIDNELEGRVYQIMSEKLARNFLEKYGTKKIENWGGNSADFEDYGEDFERISAESTGILNMTHKELVTQYFTRAACDENIVGMIIFDLANDKILASDIPKVFSEKDFESFSSMLFSFINRLGQQLKVGDINELLLRAKDYWIGGFRKANFAVFMIFTQEYFGKILPDIVTSVIDEVND